MPTLSNPTANGGQTRLRTRGNAHRQHGPPVSPLSLATQARFYTRENPEADRGRQAERVWKTYRARPRPAASLSSYNAIGRPSTPHTATARQGDPSRHTRSLAQPAPHRTYTRRGSGGVQGSSRAGRTSASSATTSSRDKTIAVIPTGGG